MLGPIGVTELIIILVIVVILFGVNKLPKLGKGLGDGIRNFKESMRAGQDDAHDVLVAGQSNEFFRQVADHGRMKCVKTLRTVEGEHSHPACDFQLDQFVHRLPPFVGLFLCFSR